jgi:hypothetical protein
MKIVHNWDHNIIANYLLAAFERDKDSFLLRAAADDTKRWNLTFALDFENIGQNNFGGTVNYDKKNRLFNFIDYSDSHNFCVRISIISKCYWSAWEHRDFLYRNVPQYYYPDKKLAKYLLEH